MTLSHSDFSGISLSMWLIKYGYSLLLIKIKKKNPLHLKQKQIQVSLVFRMLLSPASALSFLSSYCSFDTY